MLDKLDMSRDKIPSPAIPVLVQSGNNQSHLPVTMGNRDLTTPCSQATTQHRLSLNLISHNMYLFPLPRAKYWYKPTQDKRHCFQRVSGIRGRRDARTFCHLSFCSSSRQASGPTELTHPVFVCVCVCVCVCFCVWCSMCACVCV